MLSVIPVPHWRQQFPFSTDELWNWESLLFQRQAVNYGAEWRFYFWSNWHWSWCSTDSKKSPSSLVNCSATVSFSTNDLYLCSFSLDVSMWSVLWRHLGSLQQPWDAQGVHCCVWPERWCLLELKHSRKEGDWATLYNANQECFPEVQGAFLRQILYHVKMGEIIPMTLRILVTKCYQKTFFWLTLLNFPYSWDVSIILIIMCFIIIWIVPWGDALNVCSVQDSIINSEEVSFSCCCWR